MTQLPELQTQYGEGIGVECFYDFPNIDDNQRTYLDADSLAGASSLSANGINFSNLQYIVIGNPGNIKTEIVQITGSPTASTITLVAGTQFAHNRGDLIRFIPYNQIVAEQSTDGTTYVAQSAVAIRADSSETYQQFTGGLSTYYYKFRFYNSTSTLYSQYSDPTIATGFADNTLWAIKDRALAELGEVKSSLISDRFLNAQLLAARRAMDQYPGILRWSFRRKDDQVVSQAFAGKWQFNAPSDLRDRNTHKNILMVRIGRQNYPIVYQDDNRFKQNYLNVAHTTLSVAAVFGATTLTLTSSANFDASGTIKVANSIGTDATTITYTSNNRSTGVLSGVTGVPAAGLAITSEVWQGATFGLPRAYTIANGVISLDVPFSYAYDGQAIIMDYYYALVAVTTDSQTVDEPFYDHYVSWLKWKIKYLKANGKIDRDADSDYKDFIDGSTRIISQEVSGQRVNFIPDVDGFISTSE